MRSRFIDSIYGIGSASGESYSTEALAAFANYDTYGDGLTDAEKILISAYIDQEVADGNHSLKDWERIEALSGANGLVDLIGGKVGTPIGSPTHSANGYVFNGVDQYIKDNWIATVDGVNYTQNNAIETAFIFDNNKDAGGESPFGAQTSTALRCRLLISDTGINGEINTTATGPIYAGAIPQGHYLIRRSLSNASAIIKDQNVLLANSAGAATGMPSVESYTGALNLNGSPAVLFNGTISARMKGANNGFDIAAHDTNLRTLLIGLGLTLA